MLEVVPNFLPTFFLFSVVHSIAFLTFFLFLVPFEVFGVNVFYLFQPYEDACSNRRCGERFHLIYSKYHV